MQKTLALIITLVLTAGAAHATNSCRGGQQWCDQQASQEQSQKQSQGQGQSQSSKNINLNGSSSESTAYVSISNKAVQAAASAYANAPAVSNPCALSAAAGYQNTIFGFSLGASYESGECAVIRAADALQRAGQFKAALIMYCTDRRAKALGDAMRQAGTCQVRYGLSPEPVFWGKY